MAAPSNGGPEPHFGWGDANGNILPPILLRTFGYSGPIIVVLAQWQHLIMYFIRCFAWKSKICHRIDPNPTEGAHDKEKTLHLSPQNSPKYAISRSQKKLPPPHRGRSLGGENFNQLYSSKNSIAIIKTKKMVLWSQNGVGYFDQFWRAKFKVLSLSWAPSVGFGSILWQILDFRAKQWIKDIIKCSHWDGRLIFVCYIRTYVIILVGIFPWKVFSSVS